MKLSLFTFCAMGSERWHKPIQHRNNLTIQMVNGHEPRYVIQPNKKKVSFTLFLLRLTGTDVCRADDPRLAALMYIDFNLIYNLMNNGLAFMLIYMCALIKNLFPLTSMREKMTYDDEKLQYAWKGNR